jgi:hypothetical protein
MVQEDPRVLDAAVLPAGWFVIIMNYEKNPHGGVFLNLLLPPYIWFCLIFM